VREAREEVLRERRTWEHAGSGEPWHPLFSIRLACGCWVDGIGSRIWEPCMAHEGEGHVSAVSVYVGGGATARCLVRDCRWRHEAWTEAAAVSEAQDHWVQTRRSGAS
jgi:hypothetical protein